ncbi:MAG: GspE/PulE family protein [Eubacteriales bacterium]|nr:GspE/PulE family protein [Eubacteriales bacterium]
MNINYDIFQYFVYKKFIKRKDADDMLIECERMGITPEQYLIKKELVTELEEVTTLSEYYNLPTLQVDMLDIDKNLLGNFTYEFMRKHKFLPVSIDKNGVLLVAVGKPLSCSALSMVSTFYSGFMDFIYVPPTQIDVYIDSIVAVIQTAKALHAISQPETNKPQERISASIDGLQDEDDVINNPAVRLVDSIIKEAIPSRASDIHVEPFSSAVKVRYRIDGSLRDRAEFPIEAYSAISARIKILANMNIAERRIPQDGRIHQTINGKEYDFRVSSLPTIYGEKFVIRILDKSSFFFTRQDLGFTAKENALIDKTLERSNGIILLTGPTGCGKSTTLYSFLKELNKADVNIITVEDPVEYTMPGINQVQVNSKANLTFAASLRSILRQDPDIIMIGEVRDEETAQIAVRAAITGHLVFSTLHTNDAPGAITRLVDMGTVSYLLADALVCVIAQRLVKKLCPACKKKGKTNAEEMELLKLDEPVTICRPVGCQFCNNSGYRGRLGIHEIMYVNEAVRDAIIGGMNVEELRKLAKDHGLVPLWDSCRNFVLQGMTSIEELKTLNME